MKLWVDDERPAPDETWVRMPTSASAIAVLEHWREYGIPVEEISLDHDLGMTFPLWEEDTGFKVLDWMIENQVWPLELTIHTMNPVARQRMLAAANAEAPDSVAISIKYW